jgi:hypothetical protein
MHSKVPDALLFLGTKNDRLSLSTYPPLHTMNNYSLQFVDSPFGLALIFGSLIIVIVIIVVLLIRNSRRKIRNR